MKPLNSRNYGALLSFLFTVSANPVFADRLGTCAMSPETCTKRPIQSFLLASRLVGDMMSGCEREWEGGVHHCANLEEDRKTLRHMAAKIERHLEEIQLEFKSESQNPGFFFLDGQVRVAKTTSQIKDVIYINSDMVLAADMRIPEAIAILVHEIGHHFGISDHQKLDQLGARVKGFVERVQLTTTLSTDRGNEVEFTAFNSFPFWHRMPDAAGENTGRQVIWDGFDYVDLTDQFRKSLCTDLANSKVKNVGLPFVSMDELRQDEVSIHVAASFICMPKFGVGQNHFDINALGKFQFKKVESTGNWYFEEKPDSATTWELKKCTEDTSIPCNL